MTFKEIESLVKNLPRKEKKKTGLNVLSAVPTKCFRKHSSRWQFLKKKKRNMLQIFVKADIILIPELDKDNIGKKNLWSRIVQNLH